MSLHSSRVTPRSKANIESQTNMLRRQFDLSHEPYFDIVAFVENALPVVIPDFSFIIVEDHRLKNDHALTLPDKKIMLVRESVYKGACDGIGRDRFTLAHELGHFILHPGIPKAFAQNKSGVKLKAYEDSEWQANTFAGLLLAPTHLIRGKSIPEICNEFGLSFSAANVRYRQLNGCKKIPHLQVSANLPVSGERMGR